MSKHSARMSYGANMGFGRMRCNGCNEETLHRVGKCIHCGTPFDSSVPPNLLSRAQIDARNFQIEQARKLRHLSIAP